MAKTTKGNLVWANKKKTKVKWKNDKNGKLIKEHVTFHEAIVDDNGKIIGSSTL